MRLSPLLFVAALAGCVEFPDLDGAITPAARAAAYPKVAPLETVLATQPGDGETEMAVLASRAAALRARAERLRRTPID